LKNQLEFTENRKFSKHSEFFQFFFMIGLSPDLILRQKNLDFFSEVLKSSPPSGEKNCSI
jgi:hypothetical protein